MLWLLSVVALAEPVQPQLTVALGHDVSTNDPFLARVGVRASATVDLLWWLGLDVGIAYYPNFRQTDWKPLTSELIEDYRISPDLSRVMSNTRLAVSLTPVRSELGAAETFLSGLIGVGLVGTKDDLEAIQAWDDPVALEHEDEVHPALWLGLATGVRWKHWGVRARGEWSSFQENIIDIQESKEHLWVGLDATFTFGGGRGGGAP